MDTSMSSARHSSRSARIRDCVSKYAQPDAAEMHSDDEGDDDDDDEDDD